MRKHLVWENALVLYLHNYMYKVHTFFLQKYQWHNNKTICQICFDRFFSLKGPKDQTLYDCNICLVDDVL